MKLIEVQLENFRCIKDITWQLNDSLNVLVGENDAGKTAIVDAIHLVLGSVAQDQNAYLDKTDFQGSGEQKVKELRITCKFKFENDGSKPDEDLPRFIEYLTYEEKLPYLYISLEAELADNTRWPINTRFVCGKPVAINKKDKKLDGVGKKANGAQIEFEVRKYLNLTYLRPLRDADRELNARRGSRLSTLLHRLVSADEKKKEKLLGILKSLQENIDDALGEYTKRDPDMENHGTILKQLIELLFQDEKDKTNLQLGLHPKDSPEQEIKSLLERLDLTYQDGTRGLGSSNLLFIAAELTLLGSGFKLLMVEEPEAHLHPQRQLKLAKYLTERNNTQVILTTHSPNLASKFDIDSLTIVKKGDVFPLKNKTNLSDDDKSFLQRFLDVTKANLFFARGLLLVEGESEELLLPTIALLLGKDLTDNGISIVKVGSKAALRYAKVFQRNDGKKLGIPVAILTDKDEVPSKMQKVHDKYEKEDAGTIEALNEGEIKTFISNYWTLEYDLALGDGKGNSLACEMLQALYWLDGEKSYVTKGNKLYQEIKKGCFDKYGEDYEYIACQIMYIFERTGTIKHEFSALKHKRKPEMAQALATILEETKPVNLQQKLPSYLVKSLDHVIPSDQQNNISGD